jgi:hypothetical protein
MKVGKGVRVENFKVDRHLGNGRLGRKCKNKRRTFRSKI